MLELSWKRWLAENKLLNVPDRELVASMVRGGISEQVAVKELQSLADDPCFQAANHYTQLLHKRESLALIQRELAKLDPKHLTIERRSNLSRSEFLEHYYSKNRPVIICDQMQGWAALTQWTPEYLKKTCGKAMVTISSGRNENPSYETDDAKHRRTMPFSEYVDMVSTAGETNDYYMTARNEFFKNPEVLALLKDIQPFPLYSDPAAVGLFMWYGPKGTYTPLHHDIMNIFMAQVQGRKRIRLIPSSEMDLVYNDSDVYSPVNAENPDYEKFPKFRDASIAEVVLAPGELLFLPVGWWHDVKALDQSMTISFNNFVFPNQYKWANPKRDQSVQTSQQPAMAKTTVADVTVVNAMNSGMSDDWLAWTHENIKRGCDTVGIVEILEKNGFPLSVIRVAMGVSFPAKYDNFVPNIDYKVISEIPVARLEWKAGFARIENPKVQLYSLDHFLSDEECDKVVSLINTNLRPSTITSYIEGYRTSYSSDLCYIDDPIVKEVDERISQLMGIRIPYSEGIQAQKYDVGQEFKAHTDFFDPGTEEYEMHTREKGNRTWTFMIYLNDVAKGGGTQFVRLGKTILPKKGMAVIWNNLHPDGRRNQDSMHWGMPVEEGQKFIITKWFRERGAGPMFYTDEG